MSYKDFKTFVATSQKRAFEYDLEFLECIGDAMPFLFHVAGRDITMTFPPSRFFPKEYLKGMKRKTIWIDMLVASLMHDRPEESKMIALQTIQTDVNNTKTGPATLTQALEYAIVTGNRSMLNRTADLLKFLADRGYRFEEWKWRIWGYNVLHLALLYGQIDNAIILVTLGLDPRYPFVYDPAPRSAKPIHQRRRVIPTLDLVHALSTRIKTPSINTLVHEMETMQQWHTKHNAELRVRQTTHRNHVAGWTTHKYRLVQNKRRGSFETSALKSWITRMLGKKQYDGPITINLNPRNTVTSNSINNAISKHMREHTLRVPNMPINIRRRSNTNNSNNSTKPIEVPKYLFRGVHGPIAKALRRTGTYHDKGFVATSVRKNIAEGFKSTAGLMMVFKIDDLVPGTPWIWFSPHASPQSHMVPSYCDEAEVLLPPGAYTLGPKLGKNIYLAGYHPDRAARSLGGKPILPGS